MSGYYFIESAMVLLILGCCFFVRGVIGVTNKSVKLYKALKCLSCILAFKCIYLVIHISDHLCNNLIVFLLICVSFILNYINMSLCVFMCNYIWGNIIFVV